MADPKLPRLYTNAELLALVPQLTTSDVLAFLNDKLKDPACPACEKNAWTITEPASVGYPTLFLLRNSQTPTTAVGSGPVPAIPVVVMVCQHCGFVQQHAGLLIAKWKAERDA